MVINIPDNAANLLQKKATQAGFPNVEQYVISLVLPQPQSPQSKGRRSFYEAALETGFIGSGSEYPKDLSTNPEHMKGFGE